MATEIEIKNAAKELEELVAKLKHIPVAALEFPAIFANHSFYSLEDHQRGLNAVAEEWGMSPVEIAALSQVSDLSAYAESFHAKYKQLEPALIQHFLENSGKKRGNLNDVFAHAGVSVTQEDVRKVALIANIRKPLLTIKEEETPYSNVMSRTSALNSGPKLVKCEHQQQEEKEVVSVVAAPQKTIDISKPLTLNLPNERKLAFLAEQYRSNLKAVETLDRGCDVYLKHLGQELIEHHGKILDKIARNAHEQIVLRLWEEHKNKIKPETIDIIKKKKGIEWYQEASKALRLFVHPDKRGLFSDPAKEAANKEFHELTEARKFFNEPPKKRSTKEALTMVCEHLAARINNHNDPVFRYYRANKDFKLLVTKATCLETARRRTLQNPKLSFYKRAQGFDEMVHKKSIFDVLSSGRGNWLYRLIAFIRGGSRGERFASSVKAMVAMHRRKAEHDRAMYHRGNKAVNRGDDKAVILSPPRGRLRGA